MKFKSVMLLGVAVACGLVAMLGVQQVMSSDGETEDAPEEAQVLVASADIEPFTPLDESNTTFKTMPLKDVPEGAILNREECIERTLRFGVVENDVILNAKLTEKNHKPSDEIPKGYRLVTVKVNQTKTHSGLIRPGDYVDVMLTYKRREDNKNVQVSRVILQNVRVFATDNRRRVNESEGGEMNAKNMSLVVVPDDANLLILAESKGQLTMALRRKDEAIIDGPKVYDETMFESLLSKKDSNADALRAEEVEANAITQPNFEFLKENPTSEPLALKDNGPIEVGKQESWKIKIFTGTKHRIEEVFLPKDENKPTGGKPSSTEGDSNTTESNETTKTPGSENTERPERPQPTKPAAI